MKRFCLAFLACLCVLNGRAERLELLRGDARCIVETEGARIVSYSVGGRELLWMPREKPAGAQDWYHGGLPIAWPWFGRIGRGDADVHGYAWKRTFDVVARAADSLLLRLKTPGATLDYAIALDEGLSLALRTRNTSENCLPVAAAFHPYFRVDERDETVVSGYGDQPVRLTNAVDRSVHFGGVEARHVCTIREKGRVLRLVAEQATGLNLWNPGSAKRCPGVIPGDEWRHFVALEPFSMGVNRFWALPPGETHELKLSISVLK